MSPSSGKPARKERSEGFLKYFRNTSWLFVDKVVRLGAVLITSIFVTRYLGPELFGQLNYASAFVGIFFALTAMGLDDILIRDIVRRPDRRDQLMGTAAAIKLGGAVVLFITVMTLAFAKNMDTTTIMMVFLIASAEFLKPLVVVEQYFYSQVKGRTAAQVNMITVIIASLFRLGLIVVHAPLVWFAWAYIIEMGASAIGFLIAYRREGSTWKNWRYSKETALYLLRQSWPLVIYGLALYVQAKIDQVMIGDSCTCWPPNIRRRRLSRWWSRSPPPRWSVSRCRSSRWCRCGACRGTRRDRERPRLGGGVSGSVCDSAV